LFYKLKTKKNYSFILSIDCVLISKLVFGSLTIESTAAVVVDDDADGDDDKPL
jgi:hypothetical protein